MRYVILMILFGAMLAATGCGTKSPAGAGAVAQPDGVKLYADYSGEAIRLYWNSDVDQTYTIYASESLTGEWRPLEGAVNLPGNDGQMEFTTPKQDGPTRYFRLKVN